LLCECISLVGKDNVSKSNFLPSPPDSAVVTQYDKDHLADYLRLLDADTEGAYWKEIAVVIFGLDPDANDAESIYKSHLKRAKWMSESGYAQLTK